MLKYAKVINEETKQCEVGLGDPTAIFNEVEKVRTWQETEQQEQVIPAEYDEGGNIVKEETTEIVDVPVEKSETYIETMTVGEWYESIGMTERDVEQAYNGSWYLAGYAPAKPEPTREEQQQKRAEAYRLEKDPITCQINSLRDEEQTEEVIAKIAQLVEERKAKVEEIKQRFPYPVEDSVLSEDEEVF